MTGPPASGLQSAWSTLRASARLVRPLGAYSLSGPLAGPSGQPVHPGKDWDSSTRLAESKNRLVESKAIFNLLAELFFQLVEFQAIFIQLVKLFFQLAEFQPIFKQLAESTHVTRRVPPGFSPLSAYSPSPTSDSPSSPLNTRPSRDPTRRVHPWTRRVLLSYLHFEPCIYTPEIGMLQNGKISALLKLLKVVLQKEPKHPKRHIVNHLMRMSGLTSMKRSLLRFQEPLVPREETKPSKKGK
uniref:Uncharacterized protein n=1 Tax=Lactuca sativa TaxID=4236 RepID=A0A9R1UZS5_LACSA|nr:hypothetical protein LSAT_V11C700344540 [Lactuca sativa]